MTGQPIWHPSPNFGPRRDGLKPDLIVLHYTAMSGPRAALDRLCDPQAQVSAHYLIAGSGQLWQMVREEDRAWHAGAGEWHGYTDINSRSVGIELDNSGTHPFTEPQMATLELLLPAILTRWTIPPQGVIGHSDMAPGRKIDPGPRFDWARLAHQGLAARSGANPGAPTATPDQFRARARAAGYTSHVDDETLLAAVRLRHRQNATGPLSGHDIAVLPASSSG